MRAKIVLWCVVLFCSGVFCEAQEQPASPPMQDFHSAYQTVLATVNGQSVTQGEVNSFLRSRFPKQSLSGKPRIVAEQTALEHLVKRRVVYAFLVEKKYAPSKYEIDAALEKFEKQAEGASQSLKELIAEKQMTIEHFRYEAAWKLAWERYLKIKLGDTVVEKFFADNRRQFDGTKIGVSQILKKLPATAANKEAEQAIQKFKELRGEILARKISWAEAVKQFSEAPSKNDNGKLGLISIEGPMGQLFTEQAFQLETGEISEPFRSPFGIHLVRCDRVVPGKLGFRDSFDVVKQAAMKDRFEAIYEYQKPQVEIRYTK